MFSYMYKREESKVLPHFKIVEKTPHMCSTVHKDSKRKDECNKKSYPAKGMWDHLSAKPKEYKTA